MAETTTETLVCALFTQKYRGSFGSYDEGFSYSIKKSTFTILQKAGVCKEKLTDGKE